MYYTNTVISISNAWKGTEIQPDTALRMTLLLFNKLQLGCSNVLFTFTQIILPIIIG